VLSDSEFNNWLSKQEPAQAATCADLRSAVLRGAPNLAEAINLGRWLKGYIFYTAEPGSMVFALGAVGQRSVAFHAMPWYGSSDLRAKYQADMEPFVAGRSCFHFSDRDDIPHAALNGIIQGTDTYVAMVRGMPSPRT